ncbi:MAG: DUF1576 domain-containing protein [Lachnospiraceae bacterium]|nr:DUF1576 domain-containing protein [Lachnospiraceae bacterium]
MAKQSLREKIEGKELKIFCFGFILLLFGAGLVTDLAGAIAGTDLDGGAPVGIFSGIWKILISRDALITDYFELAGYGAAFINAAAVLLMAFILICREKVPFTGLTLAAFFINAGYALWGKNPLNTVPILLGTILYARLHKAKLSRYIYTALFGTSLAPLVTELVYILPFDRWINFVIAVLVGGFVGFVLPPLSMHTASMHMGYNLFNVGFATGVLAFVIVCVLKSMGIESEPVLIWREGRPLWIVAGLLIFFLFTIGFGLYVNKGNLKGILKIWYHPGRAVADFVLMDGAGTTLVNMGLIGILCVVYVWITGGDFSGPVVGAILTAFGFSAFGAHLKNYIPVLLGVSLSALLPAYDLQMPGIQLAAIFAVGIAPIAGQFGIVSGLIAGLLHAVIVMCTSNLYGGLNLYNNGFSAGWVAIVMIPVVESFMTRFKVRRRK